MNGKCARSKLNDLACRTFVDRVLDVGEVVLSSAERIDRRANRRPVRDAADRLQAGVLPVRIGVVIGRQHAAGWVGAVGSVGGRLRRAYPSTTQGCRHCCRCRSSSKGRCRPTVEAVPAVQRFAVGAVLTAGPFALPHAPLDRCGEASRAEHCAAAPPLLPAQFQDHGPLPLTAEAVPALQRFAVGALVRSTPFEEPHAPLTRLAEGERKQG